MGIKLDNLTKEELVCAIYEACSRLAVISRAANSSNVNLHTLTVKRLKSTLKAGKEYEYPECVIDIFENEVL